MSITKSFLQAKELQDNLLKDEVFLKTCEQSRDILASALLAGNKVLIAGNGGSAADSQHFAAEFVATFNKENRKGYPVIALTTDTSLITAWANDFDYHDLFAREVQALGGRGDVFIGLSTSGNSENILRAMNVAKQHGIHTIGLLGNDGGKIKVACDNAIVIPSSITARIQEIHMMVLHVWCEEIVPTLS